uniref:Uncharacterized protein n=1 Tax=Helianthus annuus TaxID=4232 RepID=A0A251TAV0_HELAN
MSCIPCDFDSDVLNFNNFYLLGYCSQPDDEGLTNKEDDGGVRHPYCKHSNCRNGCIHLQTTCQRKW